MNIFGVIFSQRQRGRVFRGNERALPIVK